MSPARHPTAKRGGALPAQAAPRARAPRCFAARWGMHEARTHRKRPPSWGKGRPHPEEAAPCGWKRGGGGGAPREGCGRGARAANPPTALVWYADGRSRRTARRHATADRKLDDADAGAYRGVNSHVLHAVLRPCETRLYRESRGAAPRLAAPGPPTRARLRLRKCPNDRGHLRRASQRQRHMPPPLAHRPPALPPPLPPPPAPPRAPPLRARARARRRPPSRTSSLWC
jgi:hypothetical protein